MEKERNPGKITDIGTLLVPKNGFFQLKKIYTFKEVYL